MDRVEDEKHSASADKEQQEGARTTRDFDDEEKRHSHETSTSSSRDSKVTTTSSTSSSSSSQGGGGSRPASAAGTSLSRHISETEVRDGIQNQRDPELGPASTIMEKVDTTAPDPSDPNLVTWTGPDDPKNPKNWNFTTKWAAVTSVSLFTLISPISSSLVAPALESISEELGITQDCKFQSRIELIHLAPPIL